eukprot:SAG11_NODE_34538_length_271_cov_0.901163_1_plen_37_part_10
MIEFLERAGLTLVKAVAVKPLEARIQALVEEIGGAGM